MDNNSMVNDILDGKDVKSVLEQSIKEDAETIYDENWEKRVWDAAKSVFADDKKLWDLMIFAPEKYFRDELQDALNAFNAWYQKFLKAKED